ERRRIARRQRAAVLRTETADRDRWIGDVRRLKAEGDGTGIGIVSAQDQVIKAVAGDVNSEIAAKVLIARREHGVGRPINAPLPRIGGAAHPVKLDPFAGKSAEPVVGSLAA